MDVSIIIPAFNAEKTLAETLESLLAQTYSQWEAIVVDDGSTDTTRAIAKDFVKRDKRIHTIHQANAGESAARNTGLSKAKHEWLLFLDADDLILPSHLERMAAALQADAALDAIICRSARVAGNGTMLIEQYMPPSGDLFPVLARRAAFPIHACVVRRSLVESVGRFDTSFRTSPDWDLWQRIARTGAGFGTIRDVLALYRISPNSASHNAHQILKDGLRVIRQGHAPDPRVKKPHPDHAKGEPPDGVRTQVFYLLSWCAGILIGQGKDARSLLTYVTDERFPELYPPAVAQCIFDSANLPSSQPSHAWEELWPTIHDQTIKFLSALEVAAAAPELAQKASLSLKTMILKQSKTWQPVIEGLEEIKKLLDEQRTHWQRLADERAQTIEQQRTSLTALEQANTLLVEQVAQARQLAETPVHTINDLQSRMASLEQARDELEKERNEAQGLAHDRAHTIEEQRTVIQDLEATAQLLTSQRAHAQGLADERAHTIEQLRAGYSEWEQIRVFLTNQLSEAQRVSEERDQTISALRASIGELEQAKALLQEEFHQTRRVIDERVRALEQCQMTISEHERENARLLDQIAKTEALAADRTGMIDQQRDGIYELRRALAHLTEQRAQTEQRNEELYQNVQQLQARLDELQRKQVTVMEQLEDSRRQSDERTGTIVGLRGTLAELERAKELVEQERSRWIDSAKERESEIAELRRQLWIRLGRKLRLLQAPRKQEGETS